MQGIIFRYQLRYITNQEQDNKKMDGSYAQVLEDVRAAVECPVCLMVPRQVPIPMCPAGHVVCRRCRRHVKGKCPTCRRKLRRDEVNSVAAFIIDKIPLKCKYDSCQERDKLANILEHEKTCTRRAQDGQDQDEDESDEDEVEREEEGEEEDVRVMMRIFQFLQFLQFVLCIFALFYELVYFTVIVASVKSTCIWIFVTFIAINHLSQIF